MTTGEPELNRRLGKKRVITDATKETGGLTLDFLSSCSTIKFVHSIFYL